MNTASPRLHSLLLPLRGFYLVLPQTTVAEIMPRPEVSPYENGPDWLLGELRWRDERVPLISFEGLCGQARGSGAKTTYAAVLRALSDIAGLGYYAVELDAIPRPTALGPEHLSPGRERIDTDGVIAAGVVIAGDDGVIPAVERVEALIRAETKPAGAD